jgi:hypothetical protein
MPKLSTVAMIAADPGNNLTEGERAQHVTPLRHICTLPFNSKARCIHVHIRSTCVRRHRIGPSIANWFKQRSLVARLIRMAHKCIALANKKLAEHNTQIEPIISFGADMKSSPWSIGIRTSKVDPRKGPKGAKPKTLLATYCPMCGESLKTGAKR